MIARFLWWSANSSLGVQMIGLILSIALLGLVVYLVTTYIPMPPIFKTVIYVLVAVILIIYIMRVFGLSDIPLPRVDIH